MIIWCAATVYSSHFQFHLGAESANSFQSHHWATAIDYSLSSCFVNSGFHCRSIHFDWAHCYQWHYASRICSVTVMKSAVAKCAACVIAATVIGSFHYCIYSFVGNISPTSLIVITMYLCKKYLSDWVLRRRYFNINPNYIYYKVNDDYYWFCIYSIYLYYLFNHFIRI